MVEKIKDKMEEYFVGKEEIVTNLIICLLAGGHVLLEDVPGVGKTTLARALAGAVDCDFGRIQFTPDTLPADVTGTQIYNAKTGEFDFREGAVMHQIILADEINRTSPKTQSSLLEAMAEKQITVDGKAFSLPQPFMVIATQNPVEFLGTYPLPEAQMDRFMMRLSLGYPEESEELRMASNYLSGKSEEKIESVCSVEEILKMQEDVKNVRVSDGVLKYARDIVDLTRKDKSLSLGASPRALLGLLGAARGCAYMKGRDYVKPDDVKAVAVNTLHHRVILSSEARIRKENVDRLLQELVLRARVPME